MNAPVYLCLQGAYNIAQVKNPKGNDKKKLLASGNMPVCIK